MHLKLELKDQMLAKWGKQLKALGDGKAHKAMARALNAEGGKMKTAVKKAVSQQSSIPSRRVESALKVKKAGVNLGADLTFSVESRDGHIPLKAFSPRQNATGTTAKVWGRSKLHAGAFMGPRPGLMASALNGHVMKRSGPGRLPIEKLWGPAVPKEMVKDAAKSAFEEAGPKVLARMERELKKVIY